MPVLTVRHSMLPFICASLNNCAATSGLGALPCWPQPPSRLSPASSSTAIDDFACMEISRYRRARTGSAAIIAAGPPLRAIGASAAVVLLRLLFGAFFLERLAGCLLGFLLALLALAHDPAPSD